MSEWPALPLDAWEDTCETLHRWTQIVGKIRMELTPLVNHWWNVPLYVTARGLGTGVIPYGDRSFDMEFDLVGHALHVRTREGADRAIALAPRSVADLYRELFDVLKSERIECSIWPVPVEIENPIPLDRDEEHHSYDPEYAARFHTILTLVNAVFSRFRGEFIGKSSPVQFYWGSFDLAVTRFSGRPAPARPGADSITREAYSHEVSSLGWWPGDNRLRLPSFYSYAAPEPAGFREARVRPEAAYYHPDLGGFYLHHDEVRRADDPEGMLLEFARSTYEAAAELGEWDRVALERAEGR